MRREDFELAFESKYKHLQLILSVCRRGEDGLLPKAIFCVATLLVGAKHCLGSDLICTFLY